MYLYNESIEQNLGGFFPDKTSETIVMHKMTTDQASCEYICWFLKQKGEEQKHELFKTLKF